MALGAIVPEGIRHNAAVSAGRLFSIVFEFPQPAVAPILPVIWGDAAGAGPGAGSVETFMPIEREQFLQPHSSDIIVHKSGIYVSFVAVNAEAVHGV